jgi:hypothetical protein
VRAMAAGWTVESRLKDWARIFIPLRLPLAGDPAASLTGLTNRE